MKVRGKGLSGLFWVSMALICLNQVSSGADWPVFRGPQRNGISTESGWDSAIVEAPVAWRAQVGLGYSAATIANGKVYLTGHDGGESDQLFCLDEATGKELWVFRYPQPKGDLYFQGGTTASVTVQGDRVFHVARQGELFCLNAADGKVLWQKHLQKDFGYSMPMWGFSGAPLAVNDRLYITAGESGIALNQSDGNVIWKSENEEAGYSTPYLFDKNGKALMIFSNKRFYNCVEAETGTKLWEVKWMTRYGVNAADPIISGDHVFISSGYGKGANCLKWDGSTDPVSLWQSREMKNQMNASVLIDGFLYGVDGNESTDGTSLKCLEMITGVTKWSDTTIGHGTVAVADGKLIVLTENGELQIAPLSSEEYRPIFKQIVVKPRVWTVPVIANGRIYCRNAGGEVAVLDFRKK